MSNLKWKTWSIDLKKSKRKVGQGLIPMLLFSGYPSDRPIAAFYAKKIKEGLVVFYLDLAIGACLWGVTFAASMTTD